MKQPSLPTDKQARKDVPLYSGCISYFPEALAEVARVSKAGNDQHNPGQPLHWARNKSLDHADCIARHLVDNGTIDTDGQRHSAKVAWRALALLQTELELARGYDAAAEADAAEKKSKAYVNPNIAVGVKDLGKAVSRIAEEAASTPPKQPESGPIYRGGRSPNIEVRFVGDVATADATEAAADLVAETMASRILKDREPTVADGSPCHDIPDPGCEYDGPGFACVDLANGKDFSAALVLSGTKFLRRVRDEHDRANKLHGGFNSLHEAYAVIAEEVDELWDEVKLKANKRSRLRIRSELVQIAAMCMKAYELVKD